VSRFHARICKIEGCPETIRAKGLCPFHYQRHLSGVAMDARRVISRDGPCLVDGCERPRRSRGLCGPHYDRGITRTQCPACSGTMKKTSGVCETCHRAAIAAQLPTAKTCRQCERTLSIDAFGLRKGAGGSAKWRSRCRECEAADARLRAKNAHRDRSKERLSTPYLGLRAYAKKLGIPWVEIVERYPADNRCEVCRRTPEEANPGGRYVRLSLDHCHETGVLRGFLCGPCNSGIGYLGDAPERLKAALAYLLKGSAPAPPVPSFLSRRPVRVAGVPKGWDIEGQGDLLEET
jgi:hypothetical protein